MFSNVIAFVLVASGLGSISIAQAKPKSAVPASVKLAPARQPARQSQFLSADWSYAEKRLIEEGFQKGFITELKNVYQQDAFFEVIDLNLLLYLKKYDYHGSQVNGNATKEVRAFMKQQKTALDEAERRYGVSPSHIAGLLWLETRHGKNQGRFHLPSVFVDLIQVERPEVVAHLMAKASKLTHLDERIASDLSDRAKRKAAWAMGELKAVQSMYKKDKKLLKNWKGSFAGAFGMSQFIPSSYIAYAKTARKGGIPDIRRADDAIMSVANYLKKNGWVRKRPQTYETALFRYNKSHDYTAAIMSISRRARQPAGGRPN